MDTEIIATDSLVDDLMSDWLERDGDTFCHIRKTDRLGWEDTLEVEDSYSTYFSDDMPKKDLIKRAYSMAKDMIISMDPPFKVTIRISNHKGSGGTDGKYLFVSTSMFDDEELSQGEMLDTFFGLVVHEGCHLLYTDMKAFLDVENDNIRFICNVIEDERIERLCGDMKPGLANFLEKVKYYFFDHIYLDTKAGKEDELSPYERLLACFLMIIRYPKYLREKDVVEFAPYLKRIKDVSLPYPTSTRQAIVLAEKIFDIIKDLYVELEKAKSESTGDGRSSDEIESDALRKFTKDAGKTSEKMAGISSAVSEEKTEGKHSMDREEMSGEVAKDSGLLGEECEGIVETGSMADTFFSKANDSRHFYLESLSRVKRFIPAISKVIKGHCREYKLIHRSMRSGVLDTSKLAEAIQGVPTVYIREGEVKTDKVSVCVLIDESGSMDGRRIIAARDAAVLINEAIGKQPNVELFIYGHSGDQRYARATEMVVYREKGFNPRYALGSVHARWENRDGVAIIETARRVRKQTDNPVLMFILSDGAPAATGYTGSEAMRHVKECVTKTEGMGFSVIQVCINHSYDPAKMFRNYIVLEDMSTLAFEMSKAIKKATMTMAKTHII